MGISRPLNSLAIFSVICAIAASIYVTSTPAPPDVPPTPVASNPGTYNVFVSSVAGASDTNVAICKLTATPATVNSGGSGQGCATVQKAYTLCQAAMPAAGCDIGLYGSASQYPIRALNYCAYVAGVGNSYSSLNGCIAGETATQETRVWTDTHSTAVPVLAATGCGTGACGIILGGSHFELHGPLDYDRSLCHDQFVVGPTSFVPTGSCVEIYVSAGCPSTSCNPAPHNIVIDNVNLGSWYCGGCHHLLVENSDFGPQYDNHGIVSVGGSATNPAGYYRPHDITELNTSIHDTYDSTGCAADPVCFPAHHTGCGPTFNSAQHVLIDRAKRFNCSSTTILFKPNDPHGIWGDDDVTIQNSWFGRSGSGVQLDSGCTAAERTATVSGTQTISSGGTITVTSTSALWATSGNLRTGSPLSNFSYTGTTSAGSPARTTSFSGVNPGGTFTNGQQIYLWGCAVVGQSTWPTKFTNIHITNTTFNGGTLGSAGTPGAGLTIFGGVDNDCVGCTLQGDLVNWGVENGGWQIDHNWTTGAVPACGTGSTCSNNTGSAAFGLAADGIHLSPSSALIGTLPTQSWTPATDIDGDTRTNPTSPGADEIASTDTTLPTVSITAPAGGATVSGSSVAVTANAADNVAVSGVQFKLDGANLNAEDIVSPYAIVWDSTATTNGAHLLTAVVRDSSGNTTTSATVSVTTNNSDTTSPTVSVTAPTTSQVVVGTISVTATAADNVGVAGVQFKLDGGILGAEDTSFPYAISWSSVTATDGAHTMTAVARDAAGNTTTSTGISFSTNNGGGVTVGGSLGICNPSPCTAGVLPSSVGPVNRQPMGTINNDFANQNREYYYYVPQNLSCAFAPRCATADPAHKPAAIILASGSSSYASGVAQGASYAPLTQSHWDAECQVSKCIVISPAFATDCIPQVISTSGVITTAGNSQSCGGWQGPKTTCDMFVSNTRWTHLQIGPGPPFTSPVIPPGSGPICNTSSITAADKSSDVPYLQALLNDPVNGIIAKFGIDPARIYITGASSGGHLVKEAMCDSRTSGLFRAYAAVSNDPQSLPSGLNNGSGVSVCPNSANRNLFYQYISGPLDSFGAYNGADLASPCTLNGPFVVNSTTGSAVPPNGQHPCTHGVLSFTAHRTWAAGYFGCGSPTTTTFGSPASTRYTYHASCVFGSSPQVEFIDVVNGGHTWTCLDSPGVGNPVTTLQCASATPNTGGFWTAQQNWNFFAGTTG